MRIIYTLVVVAAVMLVDSLCLAGEERAGVLRYEVRVQGIPRDARVIDIWMPVPPDNDEQKILSHDISANVEGELLREPLYDNQVWHGRFSRPAKGEIKVEEVVQFVRHEQIGLGRKKLRLRGVGHSHVFFCLMIWFR